MTMKYVNVAFKAYATTTLFVCDIDDIKVGDFVVVPSWNSELTGRVVSFSKDSKFSLKKPQHILRKASPKEINEVADVFGIAKNPDFIDEDDEDDGKDIPRVTYSIIFSKLGDYILSTRFNRPCQE